MKLITFIGAILLCIITSPIYAQNVGIGTSSPNDKAKLEIQSTISGVLLPRMTTAQRNAISSIPANVPEGLIVYDITDQRIYFWDGNLSTSGAWNEVTTNTEVDHDWYGVGTTEGPTNINDDVYTQGSVGIGTTTPDVTLSAIGVIRSANDAAETEYIELAHGGSHSYINWAGDGNLDFRKASTTLATIEADGDLNIYNHGILFTDTENSNAVVELRASDPSYPDDGVTLRTLTNPASGEPIFRVMSSGGAERLRVEHDGAVEMTASLGVDVVDPTEKLDVNGNVRIRGGSPNPGDVLTATSTDGTATWGNPALNVVYAQTTGTHDSNSGDDNWDNVTSYTANLAVNDGDIVTIQANMLLRLEDGSGDDDFYIRVYTEGSGGCGNFYNNEMGWYRPGEDGSDHDNFKPLSYLDYWVANCTGNVRFILQVKNNGDDQWNALDRTLIVRRN